jgi:shikimate kinase
MNIVLIGYRGTGKSSVGHILAKQMHRELISTDAEIVRKANLAVPEIVKRFGWDYFRDLESEVCRDLAGKESVVIDTGGGAILRDQNVQALRTRGWLVWLTASVPTIVRRIGSDTQRPSLTGTKSFTEEVEEVLKAREPKYQAAADQTVPTDGRSIEEVAEAILAAARKRPNG